MYRRQVREPWWDFDQRLGDEHRHRVEIGGVALQPEPLRLQGDRAAAAKGVDDRRRVVVGAQADEPARGAEDLLVIAVLPLHQLADEAEELLAPVARARQLVERVGRPPAPRARRGVDQRGEEDRPARGQRPPRPPQVQRGRVPVPDRLLARRLGVDRVQRQRDLNQLPAHGYDDSPLTPAACPW